ncbi:unnamed protein product [Brassica oleracea var. botrytis]|uniref:(rape) hypothetical protein n=1 Tax=Brassica napus TaxID=3708 RepID=A0A816KQH7_BRANA|nr:unnamed protein product [Brassica napus]
MARQTDVCRRVEVLERLESLNIDISSSSALEELFRADELAVASKSKLIIRSCDISEIEIGRTPWDIILTRTRLRNLTSVIITGCNGLKDLMWLLFVPNLTHLELQCLEKVEEIISEEKVSSSITDEPKAREMISGLKGFDGKIATKDRFLPCCEKLLTSYSEGNSS